MLYSFFFVVCIFIIEFWFAVTVRFLCNSLCIYVIVLRSSSLSFKYILKKHLNLYIPLLMTTVFDIMCMCACSVAQSCLTLCNLMDCNPTGFSVLGILQARILEWVAISFSRRSSWPRNQTHVSCVSCVAGRLFTLCHVGSPYFTSDCFVYPLTAYCRYRWSLLLVSLNLPSIFVYV